MMIGFLIPSFPLLIWDSQQQWANTRNILDYLTRAVKSHIEKSNFPSLLPEISKINNAALVVAA